MPQRDGYHNSVLFTFSLCLVFTVCIACIRAWIRRGSYGIDDAIIAVATILALVRAGILYGAIAAGLGDPWQVLASSGHLAGLEKLSVISILLFLVVLYQSKCAMVLFLGRITQTTGKSRLYSAVGGVIALLGVTSIILALANCPAHSHYYWNFFGNKDSCPSQGARWLTIATLDVLTEFVVLIMPVQLVWNLQMPKSRKIMLTMAFWVRIPVSVLCICRSVYISRLQSERTDAGLEGAIVAIFMEVELTYALAASTLSALKTFTEDFSSGFGLGFTRGKGNGNYDLSVMSDSTGQGNPGSRNISSSGSQQRKANRSNSKIRAKTDIKPLERPDTARELRPADRVGASRGGSVTFSGKDSDTYTMTSARFADVSSDSMAIETLPATRAAEGLS